MASRSSEPSGLAGMAVVFHGRWRVLQLAVRADKSGEEAYITTVDGTVYTTQTVLQLPLTYYGPPIPLDSAWTYGGLVSPASTAAASSVPTTTRPDETSSISNSITSAVPSTRTSTLAPTATHSTGAPTTSEFGTATLTRPTSSSGGATPPSSSSAGNSGSGTNKSSLLLSILLPILLVLLIGGIIVSCILFRRQRRRQRAAGTGGSYALAAGGQRPPAPPPDEGSVRPGRAAADLRRSDETEYESLPDLPVDPVIGPQRKTWLRGAMPSGIALRRRTASARGRVASNDVWTEDVHPESSSLMNGTEQDQTGYSQIGTRPLAMPQDEQAAGKPAAGPMQQDNAATPGTRLSFLARLGMFIKPGSSSRTSRQDKHASHQSSTPSAQLTIATLPSATQDTSGTSSNPLVPDDSPSMPRNERLFFTLPQPPSTPPASAREGGTAMPGMTALSSVPERHHFSFIYPDRVSEESETPSEDRRAAAAAQRPSAGAAGPSGAGTDVGESYLGDRMLRPLEPRRWTASSTAPTDYFSLPPSPPGPAALDQSGSASSRGTAERFTDAEADPRPVSITAVGGGAYLSQLAASPGRGLPQRAGATLTPPHASRREHVPDEPSPLARMSLFGGTAPSINSDERNRFSAVSYPGAPLVSEEAYRHAMGMDGQAVPRSHGPLATISSAGYEADRESTRPGVMRGMSRRARTGSQHSGDASSPWNTAEGSLSGTRQNYGDFGEPLRYFDVASNSAVIFEQPPAITDPGSARASMHSSDRSRGPSGSLAEFDEESAGATYSAAALRGRRSMPQLLPASEAVPAFTQTSRDAPPAYDYSMLRPAPGYPRTMERAPSREDASLMRNAVEERRERRSRFGRFW